MNETLVRILTAAVIAPLTIVMLVLGGWIWAVFATLVALICEYEFFTIMRARGYEPMTVVAMGVSVLLLAVAQLAGIELAAGILTAGILGLLVYQLTAPTGSSAIANVSVSTTGVLYVPWLLSHGIYLRQHTSPDGQIDLGVFAVLFVLACTFLNDTGAYFAGRTFGRHAIAPRVSPKKTWEGLIGGVLTAALAAMLIKWITQAWFHPVPYSYGMLAVFGLATGVVGFFGDLVESLLKRDADVKDSGSLLPGHGGLLDRIDAVLFTLPFAYYVFLYINRISGGSG